MQDLVPETAPHVANLYEGWNEDEILTHSILSQCFLRPVLMPAVEAGDRPTLERCLLLAESLARSGDSNVLDALFQRVVDPGSGYAHDIANRLPPDLAARWSPPRPGIATLSVDSRLAERLDVWRKVRRPPHGPDLAAQHLLKHLLDISKHAVGGPVVLVQDEQPLVLALHGQNVRHSLEPGQSPCGCDRCLLADREHGAEAMCRYAGDPHA